MPPLRWTVVEANLEPTTGAEQRGRRPVIIVSNDEFNQSMPNVTVLPLSSTRRRLYPSEVFLPAGTAGQPRDSIVMAHQVRTISKQRLSTTLGRLDDPELQRQVRQAITEHFDLQEE
jgi:mRNA interferase MazF